MSDLNTFNGDIKLILIFSFYFLAITVVISRQPDGFLSRFSKELYGIGIITAALVLITVELKSKVSSDAIIGVIGTIAGMYFGTSLGAKVGSRDHTHKDSKRDPDGTT